MRYVLCRRHRLWVECSSSRYICFPDILISLLMLYACERAKERVQDEWKYFIFYVRQSSIFVSLLFTCYALIHVCVWVRMSVCVYDTFHNNPKLIDCWWFRKWVFHQPNAISRRCLFPLTLEAHMLSFVLSLLLTVSEWVCFCHRMKTETNCMKMRETKFITYTGEIVYQPKIYRMSN